MAKQNLASMSMLFSNFEVILMLSSDKEPMV